MQQHSGAQHSAAGTQLCASGCGSVDACCADCASVFHCVSLPSQPRFNVCLTQERLKGAGIPASELPPLPAYAPQGPSDMPSSVTTALAVSVPAVPALALVPVGGSGGQGGEVPAQQASAGAGSLVPEAVADTVNADAQDLGQAGQQADGLQGVVGGDPSNGETEGGLVLVAGGNAGQAQNFGQIGESAWGESGSCEPRDLNNSHPFGSSLMGSSPSAT